MRIVLASCVAGLLALSIASCGDGEEERAHGGTSGAGGEAHGGSAGEEPAGPISSCGGLLGNSTCDPVTAYPCDVEAGETCDFSNMLGGFDCYEGPNDSGVCETCAEESGEFCGPGTTCNYLLERCEKYCCDDSDCESGTCLRNPFMEDAIALAGVCEEAAMVVCGDAQGGAGGTGSAGEAGAPAAGQAGAATAGAGGSSG